MLGRIARRIARSAAKEALRDLNASHEQVMHIAAAGQARELRRGTGVDSLAEAEFKVTSQWGEDGIIQFLIGQIPLTPARQSFIEFGVESYREANTRYLLQHDNWRGLVIEGTAADVALPCPACLVRAAGIRSNSGSRSNTGGFAVPTAIACFYVSAKHVASGIGAQIARAIASAGTPVIQDAPRN